MEYTIEIVMDKEGNYKHPLMCWIKVDKEFYDT